MKIENNAAIAAILATLTCCQPSATVDPHAEDFRITAALISKDRSRVWLNTSGGVAGKAHAPRVLEVELATGASRQHGSAQLATRKPRGYRWYLHDVGYAPLATHIVLYDRHGTNARVVDANTGLPIGPCDPNQEQQTLSSLSRIAHEASMLRTRDGRTWSFRAEHRDFAIWNDDGSLAETRELEERNYPRRSWGSGVAIRTPGRWSLSDRYYYDIERDGVFHQPPEAQNCYPRPGLWIVVDGNRKTSFYDPESETESAIKGWTEMDVILPLCVADRVLALNRETYLVALLDPSSGKREPVLQLQSMQYARLGAVHARGKYRYFFLYGHSNYLMRYDIAQRSMKVLDTPVPRRGDFPTVNATILSTTNDADVLVAGSDGIYRANFVRSSWRRIWPTPVKPETTPASFER